MKFWISRIFNFSQFNFQISQESSNLQLNRITLTSTQTPCANDNFVHLRFSPRSLSAPMSVSVNRSRVSWRSRSVLLQRASRPVVIVFSDSICALKCERSVALEFRRLCSSDSQVVRLSQVAASFERSLWSSLTTSLVFVRTQSAVMWDESLTSRPRMQPSFLTSSLRCTLACSRRFSSEDKSTSSRRCFEHISLTFSSRHRFSRCRVFEVCSLRRWRFFSRVSVACSRCWSDIISAPCRAPWARRPSHSFSFAHKPAFVSVSSFIKRSRLYVSAASSLRSVVTRSMECDRWSPVMWSMVHAMSAWKFHFFETEKEEANNEVYQ